MTGTLAELPALVAQATIASPAIVVIGDVVGFAAARSAGAPAQQVA